MRFSFAPQIAALAMLWAVIPSAQAEEKRYALEESAANPRVFLVRAEVDVRGVLKTAGKDKTLDLDLTAEAKFDFRERRLPGAGRDAAALRSLRDYVLAQASITVNRNQNFSELSAAHQLIVAQGRREGIVFYQPDSSLSRSELELLQMPGDGLAVLGLLPQIPVEVGQKWSVENWAVQMLTGTEALLKSDVSCELESVKNGLARVRFSGTLEGAVQGATTQISLSGHFIFDTQRNYLRTVELEQAEKRGVGPVTPGMDVTAKVKLDRSPSIRAGKLTENIIDQIPLEPAAEQLELTLKLPWNARITHQRDWHVFQRTPNLAVLRLVKDGSLIAQCNLSPLAEPKAGGRMSDADFRDLVRKGLGENLESIVRSHTLSETPGFYLHRIIAQGQSQKIDMTWHYYHAAAKDRQMLFFVAVETQLKDKLGEADLDLIKTLKFETPELVPAGGEK